MFRFSKYKQPCFKRKSWKYESGDYDLLNQLIYDFDWTTVEHDNINTYAENFTNKILEFCESAIPSKVVTIRPSDPPWVKNALRNAIRKHKRAHKFAKRKTDTMLCTSKRNRVNDQSLSFSGEIVKEVTSHKHLGLNLTSSCDWITT